MMVCLQLFRWYQRRISVKCDIRDIAAVDYTVYLENIPVYFDALNNDYDDDLKYWIESEEKNKVEIVKVNLVYDLTPLFKLQS